ncbi:glycosyltransferase [Pedobacter gandavensis]|uniref:glycosyltransferase n=1 Tax=Pedobacter gandavensis TaxID=2679963 RepID=UPI00292E4A9F|nr:glycosyltransferase [Pedobacter gandavensis]
MSKKKCIIINSTAASSGGALTIINEFIGAIIDTSICNEYDFIFFTSVDFKVSSSANIKFINLGKKSNLQRIQWDYVGFKSFLKRNNLKPDLIISFQNTGVRYPSNCTQLIYFHNTFCLLPYKWNLFKKSERTLWFYTWVYPLFIRALINKNTKFIVQANWIKKDFARNFSVEPEKITVIPPTVKSLELGNNHLIDDGQYRLFFPATSFVYKNHGLLFKMLSSLKNNHFKIYEKILLVFTLSEDNIIDLGLLSEYKKVSERVLLLGYINKEQMVEQYINADIVVFPSLIETFGLPLIEAASLNKRIICANEKYAYETLANYGNVDFINSHSPDLWAEKCAEILPYGPVRDQRSDEDSGKKDSWGQIIDEITKIIN